MSLPVTSFAAAVLALLTIALAFATVVKRVTTGHSWGDGGNAALHRTIRAHAHLAEYAPTFLVVLGFGEARGLGHGALTALAGAFLAGRALAIAYSFVRQVKALRIAAFWLSALPIVVPAVWLLVP